MRRTSPTSARIGRRGAVLACLALLGLTGIALGVQSVVRRTHDRSFTVTATPAKRSVRAGTTTTFTLRARQRRYRGTVRLRITSKLPRGTRARFVRAGRGRWRLRVTTRTTTPAGRYRLTLRATRTRPPRPVAATPDALRAWRSQMKGRRRLTVRLRLTITSPRLPFSVAGDATGALSPGGAAPVDARITNPNGSPLHVTALRVVVSGVRGSDPAGCTLADFGAVPYAGPPVTVPARATRSLSQLAIAPAQWPQVVMLNRPVRQDGCRGAALTLSFDGSGKVDR